MTTGAPSRKLLTACSHEAGHALIAHLEGVPISSVSASATGTGKVEPVDIDNADQAAVLRIAHAGVIAERMCLADRTAHLDVNSDDGRLAFRAKNKLGGDHQRLDKEAREAVEAMLKEHEVKLHALAKFICARPNKVIPWSDIEAELDKVRTQTDD